MDSLTVAMGAVAAAQGLALLVGLSAVCVPALVVVLLARWRPRGGLAHGPGRTAAARAAATLPAALYAILALDYALTDQAAPARARLARALGAPIVEALDRYRGDRLEYPDDLPALVPLYLSPEHYRAAERSALGRPFELEQWGDAFVLRLRFGALGDALASCEFSSRTRRWYCAGGS